MSQILRIKGKMASIHRAMAVLNQNDEKIYHVKSKAVSVHDTTQITDAGGKEVAKIHAKIPTIHNIYYVEMADGQSFQLSSELLRIRTVIDIPELNWQLRGNIIGIDFVVIDNATGYLIAKAQRKIVTLHGTYYLEVYDECHRDELVAIFVVLKHLIDRRITEKTMDNSSATNQMQF